MNCTNCARTVRPEDLFCLGCGERVSIGRAGTPTQISGSSTEPYAATTTPVDGVESDSALDAAEDRTSTPGEGSQVQRPLPPAPPPLVPTDRGRQETFADRRISPRGAVIAAVLAVLLLGAVGAFMSRSNSSSLESQPPDTNEPAQAAVSNSAPSTPPLPSGPTSTQAVAPPTSSTAETTAATAPTTTTTVPLSTTTTLPPTEISLSSATVSASGVRTSVRLRCTGELTHYTPDLLIDGDLDTGWGAGQDNGEGESVAIDFGRDVQLTQIGLTPGFAKVGPRRDNDCRDTSAFGYNAFVSQVRYTFGDGSSVVQDFAERPDLQVIDLVAETGGFVSTRTVRITILDVEFPPGADRDTILSEAAFWGYE